jgi:hypothetical protein
MVDNDLVNRLELSAIDVLNNLWKVGKEKDVNPNQFHSILTFALLKWLIYVRQAEGVEIGGNVAMEAIGNFIILMKENGFKYPITINDESEQPHKETMQ